MNEEKIIAILTNMASDQAEFRREVREKLYEIAQEFVEVKALIASVDERVEGVIDRLEDIEAKNLERHAEMRADISENRTDIDRIKKIK